MSEQNLATYLNDHLAGSVVALELLEHLSRAHVGTSVASFADALHGDIFADRKELETLMGRLNVDVSRLRKASAWLTEKATELKLRIDDAAGGPLHLLEVLEAVSLGIEGKLSLWRALTAAGISTPGFADGDYRRLEHRAQEQRGRVENMRLDAARSALG